MSSQGFVNNTVSLLSLNVHVNWMSKRWSFIICGFFQDRGEGIIIDCLSF